MKEISVIIPVYNEEKNIPVIYDRLCAVLMPLVQNRFELIFVNDGSRDGSIALIKELSQRDKNVGFIDFSRNFGHQIAVSAGIDMARGSKIVIIDADLQDPPELIADMHKKSAEGYEVIYARRKNRKGESWFKKTTAGVFYRILNKITQIEIPLDTGDFRMIDRKVAEILRSMPEKNKFLRGQISWIGFNQTFVEYDRDPRLHGSTGYPFRKMLQFAVTGITSFSDFPLRFATIFGFFVSGISFVVMLFALYSRFITRDYQPGWASIILAVLFIGGVQLITIGIIGEYIGRLYNDVRNRPLYVVRETNLSGGTPTKTEYS